MQLLNIARLSSALNFIILCQLSLFHCNLDSKLSLTMNKFLTINCTFHHLVGENETTLWPSLLSPLTSNVIEKFSHDPTHTLSYDKSYSQFVNDTRSRLSQGQKSIGGNCAVKIIHLGWSQRNYRIVDNLLEEDIILRNENPDYVLFVAGSKTDDAWTPESFNLRFGVYFYTLTSKFLFLDENFDLYLLCSHCTNLAQLRSKEHFKLDIAGTELEEIDVMWFKVHSNLDKGVMEINRINLWHFYSPQTCSPYKSGLNTPSFDECVIIEVQKRFNFSIPETPNNTNTKIVGVIYYGPISGATFNRDMFLTPSRFKQSWINYACTYKPYILVTLVGSSNANFLTLLEPLDRYCWVGLISTYISVTILIFANSKLDDHWENRIGNVNDNNITRIKKAWLWGLSVLMEQSCHHLLQRFRWTWIPASCWILLSFLVSNGYKGDLFSSMAAQRHPTLPNSIDDLINHYNLPVTKHYLYGKYAQATLKEFVLPDMAEGLPSNSLHQRLLTRLIFLNGTDAALISNISMGLKVNTDLGYPVTLTDNFALISSESDAKIFTTLGRRFTKYSSIQNPSQVSPYITRVPWFGYRNFFLPPFIRSLSSLLETGIYGKWSRYHEIADRIQALKQVDDRIHQKSGGHEISTNNNSPKVNPNPTEKSLSKTNYYTMATLGSNKGYSPQTNSLLKGVSLENVKIAIIFCSICTTVASLVFVFEVVVKLRQILFKKGDKFQKNQFYQKVSGTRSILVLHPN